VCDLETSRMGAPYIYDISRLWVKHICAHVRTCTHTHLHRQHHNLKKETYFLFEGINISKCLIFGAQGHVNSVFLYLQTMILPYATFLALMSCVIITRVSEAVNKRKRKTNMSLNQHPALPKHTILTRLKPFYAYSTGEHHQEGICQMVLVLFHPKM